MKERVEELKSEVEKREKGQRDGKGGREGGGGGARWRERREKHGGMKESNRTD